MKPGLIGVVSAAVLLGGCRTAAVETGPGPGPAQPAPPTADALPAGTLLRVRLDQTLSTDDSRVGQRFRTTVTESVVARNGQVVVPAGSVISGTVTGLDPSERLGDQAAIRLDFDRLDIGNRTYPYSADVVEADVRTTGEVSRAAERAAIGAIAGAALGAIIGGDLAATLIGGALGAGAGTIISLGFGDVDAELPEGTEMTLRTDRSIPLR